MAKYAIVRKRETKPYGTRFDSPEEAWDFVHESNKGQWDVVEVVPATAESYRKMVPVASVKWVNA